MNTHQLLGKPNPFRLLLSLVLVISLITPSVWAQAPGGETSTSLKDNSSREFIMSCVYGVLAGTLVGSAMLAFTDQPGENLNKVARGASIGLYAGILLGMYVVYIVPNQIEKKEQELYEQGVPGDVRQNWNVFPLISEQGIEGVAGSIEVLSF